MTIVEKNNIVNKMTTIGWIKLDIIFYYIPFTHYYIVNDKIQMTIYYSTTNVEKLEQANDNNA